jgi:hypothetical protein
VQKQNFFPAEPIESSSAARKRLNDVFRKGDPWGYDQPFVQDKHKQSIEFVCTQISPAFDGIFVELGAYNGEFTKRLCACYPTTQIICSDLSDVAIDLARKKLADSRMVSFQQADIRDFMLPAQHRGRSCVLFLMDCFYALDRSERHAAMRRLVTELYRPQIIFSTPMTGPEGGAMPHFDEAELFGLFQWCRYRRSAFRILNFHPNYTAAINHRRLRFDPWYRRKVQRDVIYHFKSR